MSGKNRLFKSGKTIRLWWDFCWSQIFAGFGKSAGFRPELELKSGTALVVITCWYCVQCVSGLLWQIASLNSGSTMSRHLQEKLLARHLWTCSHFYRSIVTKVHVSLLLEMYMCVHLKIDRYRGLTVQLSGEFWFLEHCKGNTFFCDIIHHHFWHAPLEVCSAKRRLQSPEWMILSHLSCFIQGEVIGFQVLPDSLHPHSTRVSWWSPRGSC